MQPGAEKLPGARGSANTNPSLDTFRSMSENMCCAIAVSEDCGSAACTRAYLQREPLAFLLACLTCLIQLSCHGDHLPSESSPAVAPARRARYG